MIGVYNSIWNNINVPGDLLYWPGGYDNNSLFGNINLAPNGTGGTRTINEGSVSSGLEGVISGSGCNVIFTGGNWHLTNGMNTYTGTTTLQGPRAWPSARISCPTSPAHSASAPRRST